MAKATQYDFSTLTMREVALIESLSGQGLASLGKDDAPKALVLAAIAFTFKLREDAAYTWNQAQELTLKEIGAITSALQDLDITTGDTEADEIGTEAA